MTPAPTVPMLINTIETDAGDQPLDRLAAASAMARELEGAADSLLNHFVEQCRNAGHSWTEISGALGVTKQAVHKRFSTTNYTFERFTNRARQVLSEAKSAAIRLGQPRIGTEHMLLGLFPPGGLAHDILTEAGVARAKVEKKLARGDSKLTEDDAVPFSDHAKAALETALREALGLGHNYIGTEHLLLALLHTADSSASQLLGKLGVDATKTREAVIEKLKAFTKPK